MAAAPDMQALTMGEEALRYLARGLPVFPVCSPLDEHRCQQHGKCGNAGKVPLVKWEAFQVRLPYEQEVAAWWRKWKTANIGMATGQLPGIVVLDADGSDARKEALRRGVLQTPAIWTGRPGGAHYWLRHPGRLVANFAHKLPGIGIDFRGDGGYVLLPPSLHWTGNRYRWADGTEDLPPAELPSWLDDLLAGRTPPGAPPGTTEPTGDGVDMVALLNGLPEGQRNAALWSFAGKLRHDNIPRQYAEFMVQQAARACRPPLEEAVALDQVRRAYERYAPEPTWDAPEVDDDDPFEDTGLEPWAVHDVTVLLAKEYPPIPWRIEGWAREGALVWVFGPPGTIKTYIATDAALAVATGGLFLQRFPTQAGTVLIVQEDTQEADYVQEYIAPMVAARGIPSAQLGERVFVAPPAGMRFDALERLKQLAEWLEEHRPQFVVLDAWYLLQGDAESFGKEQRRVVTALRAIRRRFGGVWWIVDHNRKGGAEKNADENAIDRLMGGREKSAAADAVLEVLPTKGDTGHVFLNVVKMRGAKPTAGLQLSLVNGLLTIDGQRRETPTGAAEEVYEWLLREGGSRTKEQIIAGVGFAKRTVDDAITALLNLGRVRLAGKHGKAHTWLAIRGEEKAADDFPW